MKKLHTDEHGFAVSAALGIIAVIALLGGATYVATHDDAQVDATVNEEENASTTADGDMRADAGFFGLFRHDDDDADKFDIDLMGGVDATSDTDASVKDEASSSLELDVNGGLYLD